MPGRERRLLLSLAASAHLAYLYRMNQVTAPLLTSRAEATRAAIVSTAEQLFRSLGYQKTTVADIARALHMSSANIYRFFPSKAAINEAICERVLAELEDVAWAEARRVGPATERMRALFSATQARVQDICFSERRMHDMISAAMAENWPAIEAYIRRVDGAIAAIVADGQQQGCFAPLDPEQAGRLVHACMICFAHPTVVEQCLEDDLPRLAAEMADFVLRALRA